MFEDIIEEEMNNLIEMAESNNLSGEKSNNFLITYEWEDDFSHNQISEMQYEFKKQAEKYLDENFKDQYVVYVDWCVHVCTIDFMNKYIYKNK